MVLFFTFVSIQEFRKDYWAGFVNQSFARLQASSEAQTFRQLGVSFYFCPPARSSFNAWRMLMRREDGFLHLSRLCKSLQVLLKSDFTMFCTRLLVETSDTRSLECGQNYTGDHAWTLTLNFSNSRKGLTSLALQARTNRTVKTRESARKNIVLAFLQRKVALRCTVVRRFLWTGNHILKSEV